MTDTELADEIEYAELCRFTQEQIRQIIAALRRGPEHELYKTGDLNAPSVILDSNGEVVLGLCKRCGKGEADLAERCERPPSGEMVTFADVDAIWENLLDTQADQRPNNRDVLNNMHDPQDVAEFCKYAMRFALSAAEAEGRKS